MRAGEDRTIGRLAIALIALAALFALTAPAAQAAFGIRTFEVGYEDATGNAAEAGTHPFAVNVGFGTEFDAETLLPEGWIRDFTARQPAGLVGDTTAYKRCSNAEFLTNFQGEEGVPDCPLEDQVGIAGVSIENGGEVGWLSVPVFNLTPPPGSLLRLGFSIKTQKTYIDVSLADAPPYNGIAATRNAPQIFPVFGALVQLWGDPSDPAHAGLRRGCAREEPTVPPPPGDIAAFRFESKGTSAECEAVAPNQRPFLTMPTDCADPLRTDYEALSWNDLDGDGHPDTAAGSVTAPAPRGCERLELKPRIAAAPTNRAASSPTGLDFELAVDDEGLVSTSGRAQSAIRKTVVTLPRGMTINPSQAEGLIACSEADLARESVSSGPGQGCPQASKVGTVAVDSPLTDQTLQGSLYVAEPYRNLAGDSLIAVYLVVKSTQLGIIVKQPIKVEPDSEGRLIATAEEIPQLPFSSFRLHFREGGRSPLVTPAGCGDFTVAAEIYPWSGNAPAPVSSEFQISSGSAGAPCPTGPAPFRPGLVAGTLANAAGTYAPFFFRLTRGDGEQDISRLSATLPPGLLGRLAGLSRCADAQIATAKAKSGRDELRNPSCPAGSRIGATSAGAGVGSQLTYVPGSLYLAGPTGGDPLSVVAITPAVAGPFDLGTVVVRQALTVDPRSGEVQIDGAASDPIPHMLAGIPLLVRDLRVSADKPNFTLNPTSCRRLETRLTAWGAGTALEPRPESPVALSAPFHAVNCAKLGFKPRLALRLRGGTRRGAHPAVRGVLRPRKGDANLRRMVLRLPRSAFLEQAHIRTVCTRVQFAAGPGHGARCPKGSVYGHVVAFTPLLSEPLKGPVILRSSNHKLPDMVLTLHGIVDIEAVARIDSKRGGIRLSFEGVPDAPLSRAIVRMQGGRKGLVVNSRNLCARRSRASSRSAAHNGRRATAKPLVRASCRKAKRARRSGHRRRG